MPHNYLALERFISVCKDVLYHRSYFKGMSNRRMVGSLTLQSAAVKSSGVALEPELELRFELAATGVVVVVVDDDVIAVVAVAAVVAADVVVVVVAAAVVAVAVAAGLAVADVAVFVVGDEDEPVEVVLTVAEVDVAVVVAVNDVVIVVFEAVHVAGVVVDLLKY